MSHCVKRPVHIILSKKTTVDMVFKPCGFSYNGIYLILYIFSKYSTTKHFHTYTAHNMCNFIFSFPVYSLQSSITTVTAKQYLIEETSLQMLYHVFYKSLTWQEAETSSSSSSSNKVVSYS